jgi:hypothetical protein
MRFNIGDSVLCTTDDDNEKYRLTPGKYYTILQNSNSHVVVNNDYGKSCSFWPGRFNNVCQVRDDKLKIILGID